MLKKGNASAEGTQRFVSRMRQEFSTYNQTSYRYLNGTDLMVSKVGYGSYRVDQQVDEHIESLEDSMRSGCNIIDTSSNYTNGASETLIGNVLTKMMNQGEIERDEIIL
ncbi:MAG: aldo/keto reductase, partial [Candidatus Poribacteria bacterium]|nr:aldo/keto reductase [Candidatus Poribacteria bacterium]